jgi:hypothetical protein
MTDAEVKEARGYAWGYFSLHADQRMKLFNFFLSLSGLLIAAVPAVRSIAPGTKLVVILPLFLSFSAFVFWRLDERTRQLVKNAENAIKFLDQLWPVPPVEGDGLPHCLRLIERDEHITKKLKENSFGKLGLPITYNHSFRLVFLMTAGLGFALAAWVIVST